ncbi:cytosol aminopeptidase-like [Branchiostoma floridae x Branchiostoma belcheri]
MAAHMRFARAAVEIFPTKCFSPRLHGFSNVNIPVRYCSSTAAKRGLVLGVYEKGEGVQLTPGADLYNQQTGGKLAEYIRLAGPTIKKGKSRVFYGLDETYSAVAVVGLGAQGLGVNELEGFHEGKENLRAAAANGVRQLRDILGTSTIEVDGCSDAEAAAEGADLGLFAYDELKAEDKRKKPVETQLLKDSGSPEGWTKGCLLADGQNFARKLMEMPASHLTPTTFANITGEKFGSIGNVEFEARDRAWAESMKMGAYLSVTNGSEEPPVFVEVKYSGSPNSSAAPLVLVGKGITFDSGGISLKPPSGMDMMRGDMGGAATVSGAIAAIAALKLPINIVGLIPLCENMPSGRATRPGDVVTAMNGKTIQVDNTDAEGRLILADALCYAHSFNPRAVIDLATLTGAIDVALGSAAAGVFSNSRVLWNLLHDAGVSTGDRLWRMPLFSHYTKQISPSQLADLNNTGKHGRQAGACTAAAFLREFVQCPQWAHLDIAGVMANKDEVPYLNKGMAGRPVRTLVQFAANLANQKWI